MNWGGGKKDLYVEVRRGLVYRRKERSREGSTQERKNDLEDGRQNQVTGERKGPGAVTAG